MPITRVKIYKAAEKIEKGELVVVFESAVYRVATLQQEAARNAAMYGVGEGEGT